MTGAWLSIASAAELTGYSKRTVWGWTKTGRVDWTYTAGGSIRIWSVSLWRTGGESVAVLPEWRKAPPSAYVGL